MDIATTRFGRLEVNEERIIAFPHGLLGFPQLLAQTLDFGIGFLQFSLFLPQLLAQNFEFLFEFLDSLEGAVRACHSKLR